MAQLLSRVREARNAQTPPPRCRSILLLDTVRDLIETNHLVEATGLSVEQVFAALSDLHDSVGAEEKSPPSVCAPVRPTCHECRQGYMVIDHREGVEVCDHCGLQGRERLNLQPEFEHDGADVARASRFGVVPGVSKWVVQMIHEKNEDTEVRKELEHWNYYVNLSSAELEEVRTKLRGWARGGHNRLTRIVAAMLHNTVVRNMRYDENTVRDRVRNNSLVIRPSGRSAASIEPVEERVQVPLFFCPTCNEGMPDRRSARWHCKWNPWALDRKRQRLT